MGAAVDAEVFAQTVAGGGPAPRAVNAGEGYTTVVERYLGFRNAAAAHPAAVAGVVAFVEAPGGLPDPATWADDWCHPARPGILSDLLRRAGPASVWGSGMNLEMKLRLTAGTVTRRSALFRVGPVLFAGAVTRIRGAAGTVLLPDPDRPADLTGAGGVLADTPAVAAARELAVDLAAKDSAGQQPYPPWDRTVFADYVRAVREVGGRVVVFEMPLSEVQAAVYRTPVRDADRRAFRAWAAAQGVGYVRPEFPTTDDDFPDLWHLRASRAGEFTRRLAEVYMAARP